MSTKNLTQIYSFEKNQFRMLLKSNEPWFALVDVTNILDLKNPSHVTKILDDDEKTIINIHKEFPTQNVGNYKQGNPNITFISESGLFKCIFNSNKPEAKKFTNWVTKEVLPQLRKTGSYSLPDKKELKKQLTNDRLLFLDMARVNTMLIECQETQFKIVNEMAKKLNLIPDKE